MLHKKRLFLTLLIIGILLIPFCYYQHNKKKGYNFYEGKITDVSVGRIYRHSRGSSYYEELYQPTVKYIKGKDTVIFTEDRQNIFARYYKTGDIVKVAEQKGLPWNVRIYSFWYFIKGYEIALYAVALFILYILIVILPEELKKKQSL